MKKRILLYCIICLASFILAFLFWAGAFWASDEVPDIQFSFQQPSYVTDKNIALDSFVCDPTKTECKINFDLTPSFVAPYKIGDFACEIVGIDPLESVKCNPNTVTFWSGTTEVIFAIKKKWNLSVYKTRTIIIVNEITPIDSGETDSGSTSTGSILVDSWSLSNTGDLTDSGLTQSGLTIPEIRFTLQQTTYFTDKNPELSEFDCDPTKSECKANFSLEESFTGGFRESDYMCHIDGITETESGKCNPNQVVFGSGNHTVIFSISEKNNPTNFRSRQILVRWINQTGSWIISGSGEIISSWQTSSGSSNTGSLSNSWSLIETWSIVNSGGTNTGIIIPEPKITIQSGIDVSGKCTQSACSVNVTGEESFSGLRISDYVCQWSFSGATELSNTDSCNPSYAKYGYGNFSISLKIFAKTDSSVFKQTTFSFSNPVPVMSSGWGGTPSNIVRTPIRPVAKITPQSLSSEKTFTNNILTCFTPTDTCAINLTGEESIAETKNRIKYSWDYSDGKTRTESNPTSIYLPLGVRTIRLMIIDEFWVISETEIQAQIFKKWTNIPQDQKTENTEKQINFSFPVRISRADPNPYGGDTLEWVELENTSSGAVDISDCILSDTSHKKYIFPSSYLLSSGRQKFYSTATKISLTNTKDTITFFCQNTEISRISWDFPVPDGFIIDQDRPIGAEKQKAKVVAIFDGDTIDVEIDGKMQRVRFLGIDAPELDDKNIEIAALAKKAREFLDWILYQKEIELTFEWEKYDTHGWMLAYISFDGKDTGEELIRLWEVRPYFVFPFSRAKIYDSASYEAKKKKLGIWENETIAKIFTKQISEEKAKNRDFQKERNNNEAEEYLENSSSGSEVFIFQKLLETNTAIHMKDMKDGSVIISWKTLSGAIILFWLSQKEDMIDFETSFSGSKNIARAWTNGEYEYRIFWLDSGDYIVRIAIKIPSQQKWFLLEKKVKLSVHSTKSIEKTFKEPQIVLQWKIGKNLVFSGSTIVCSTKKECTINLSVDSHSKEFVYEWNFSNGIKILGYNPKSIKLASWKYSVSLFALNTETGEQIHKKVDIIVKKIVSKKKTKKPKKAIVKKWSVVVKNNIEPTLAKSEFDTTSLAMFWIVGGLTFSTGAGILIKKRFLLG